ncbi:MAG: hypothetical protein N4A33_04505 [Bacteriovoracaceae bacterium]|jgi:hypothetical protein|nr:hypothetical protein [Bacteriovoracaceae bacterium]
MGVEDLKNLFIDDTDQQDTKVNNDEVIGDLDFSAANIDATKVINLNRLKNNNTDILDISDTQGLSTKLAALEQRVLTLEQNQSQGLLAEYKNLDKKITMQLQKMIKLNPSSKNEAVVIKKLLASFAKKLS